MCPRRQQSFSILPVRPGLTADSTEGIIISMTVELKTPVARPAELFRALSDPTRLAIFTFIRACGARVEIEPDSGDVCSVSDTCVGDICCRFDIAPSTVSHHLRELREAGLIQMERRGRWVYVAVNEEAVRELRGYLDQHPSDSPAAPRADTRPGASNREEKASP